jgi:UDP:flavonoid glycosyltransferase YjiC (YdhE family)
MGHINPMVPLAFALRDRGHHVRWVTGPDAGPRLEAAGIEAVPIGVPWDANRAAFWARYPEVLTMPPAEMPDYQFPRLFGEIVAPTMLPGLLEVATTWRPDLVVHDAAEFSGAIAAASIGIPSVTHSFGALTPAQRVSAAGDRVAALWRSAGLEPRPFGGSYDTLYLDIYPASMQSADMGHVPFRQALRPLSFDDRADGEPVADITSWAGQDRPLIYLTFGTVYRDAGALRTAVDAIASLDVQLLVTVGPAGDPDALGEQPANVRIERYIPQSTVFAGCDLVVSHAGSGTFLGGLGRGIPQLCLPQGADQFLNADACRRAGAGLVLEPAEANQAAIAAAVSRILADGSFRARAGAVAAEIAAMPGPDVVAAALERLS